MKKSGIAIVFAAMLVFSFLSVAFAQQEEIEDLPEYLDLVFSEPIEYNFFINNEKTDYSMGKPYLSRDMVVMIPVRVAVEKMGYKVVWNEKIRTIIIYNDDSMYILKINRNRYYSRHNSSAVLSKEPVIKDSRTYVPLEFFTTLMKVDVKIDSGGNLLIQYR
ncbi:MAG: copper amine oxidase N-terminal domain-containing protein [Peptostreptococcaceae bacterium]|nr:copper amine oxidase N-terminal domain-containing protein [Peptostreptococcaceae bacterium]